jgi:hypothetical protein
MSLAGLEHLKESGPQNSAQGIWITEVVTVPGGFKSRANMSTMYVLFHSESWENSLRLYLSIRGVPN